ncbi:hypothetical protein CLOM_g2238 [Closterium sp. NIES-68]|nr:hypothetical protein CLOM_g2238 [Closterium sp. NIES-68]GJP58055.1 hypothetical protein CLOP_g20162 [Closterium sp. NIES-67]
MPLPPPLMPLTLRDLLSIYRLLEGLSPQYEVRVIAFTEAQPHASLDTVVQWIINAEARLLSTPPSGLNSTESQNPQLAVTQPRRGELLCR